MNTRSKGQRIERLARQVLESKGARVEPARPVTDWSTGRPLTPTDPLDKANGSP